MRRLTTLFPSEFLEEHAEELGVVEREGKLQVPVLVWALVFGFAASGRNKSCIVSVAGTETTAGVLRTEIDVSQEV